MRSTRSIHFLLIFAFAFMASPLVAQELTKEERREWRNRAKDYKRNPEALKAVFEEMEEYRERALAAEAQQANLQATANAKDRQISAFEEQIAELNQELLVERQAPPPVVEPVTPTPMPGGGDQMIMDGVVFRVQIGAFSRNRVDESLDTSENLTLENSEGVQRVMVGQFRSYPSAKALRDRLRTMGVSDAFIAAYRDGVRVDVEQVTGGQ